MEKRTLPATLAVALLCLGGAVLAPDVGAQTTETTTTTTTLNTPASALSESTIKSDIAEAGYKEVKGLKFDDGVWQAKARGGNDKWSNIKVGPTTGKVYEADAPSRLNQNEVKAKLTAQGYQNISDVKFDKGLWSADAKNQQGHQLKLLVDPDDGNVVAVRHH